MRRRYHQAPSGSRHVWLAATACLFALLGSACSEGGAPSNEANQAASEECDPEDARALLTELGTRAQRVPLLAPDSILQPALREAYDSLVTPELLDRWLSAPIEAPGRETSSPWPERMEIDSVVAAEDGSCRVYGTLVYVTSTEAATGGEVGRRTVVARVVGGETHRVAELQLGAFGGEPDPDGSTAAAAVGDPEGRDPAAVIRRYYEAVNAGDYQAAYALWGDSGRSSGQSFEEFAAGYSDTESVQVEIGEPGRVEAAAGSRYIRIPVVLRARLKSGEEQRFEGTYTLRRAVVDGATEAQRRWHIDSAELRETS